MIVKTEGICGGSARVKGTRIPVWGIIKCIQDGVNDEKILTHYPSLTQKDLDDISFYYAKYSKEIDKEIEENNKL